MKRKKEVRKSKNYFRIDILYDAVFWTGVVLLVVSYFKENLNITVLGLIFMVLSLFVYELFHKKVLHKKKNIGLVRLFYTMVFLAITLLAYLLRDKLLLIIRYPLSLVTLYVLYLVVLITIISIVVNFLESAKQKKLLSKTHKKSLFRWISITAKKTKNAKKAKIVPKKHEKHKKSPPSRINLNKFFRTLTILVLITLVSSGVYILISWLPPQNVFIYIILGLASLSLLLFFIYLLIHAMHKRQIARIGGLPKLNKLSLPETRIVKTDAYETDFDSLYYLVQKRGKLKLSQVAKIFGVDKKTAESWAQVLDEHNLLRLHYPPIGEPELVRLKTEQSNKTKNV